MPKINNFSRNNLFSLDTLTELFSTWLNQPLLTTSNPTFNNLYLTENLNSDGIYTKKLGVGTSVDYSNLVENSVIIEGKVGIGTTNPAWILDINTSMPTDGISLTGLSGNNELYFDIDNTNSMSNLKVGINTSESYISQTGSGPLVFKTGSTPTEALRITDTGSVGIGTSDPIGVNNYLLNVNGNINFTGNLYKNDSLFVSGGGSSNVYVDSYIGLITALGVNCISVSLKNIKNMVINNERLLSFVAEVDPSVVNTKTSFRVKLPNRTISNFNNVYDITGTVKGFTENTNVNIENCFLKAVTSGGQPQCEISFTSSNNVTNNIHYIQITLRYTANDPVVGNGIETPIITTPPTGSSFVNLPSITVYNYKAILVDNEMTFSCVIEFTPVIDVELTSFEITLPSKTTNFTNVYDISGTISGFTVSDINIENAFIKAVVGTPRLFISCTSSPTFPTEIHYLQLIVRYTVDP